GKEIPDYSLVVGVPGKVVRQLSEEEIEMTKKNAEVYIELAEMHIAKRKRIE
ncbi:MAG TPA: gamma carbonic anhydrase family protein, partial [Thermococcus litoralis]|nr:gamma carbonic anhydrase family protein [Thermococcus litoralis]